MRRRQDGHTLGRESILKIERKEEKHPELDGKKPCFIALYGKQLSLSIKTTTSFLVDTRAMDCERKQVKVTTRGR